MTSARPAERAPSTTAATASSPAPHRNHLLAAAPYVAVLLAVALIPVALTRAGFLGISDDDAARSLIAWDFVHEPRIDPTRSSWLPAHTYLVGSAMAATGELRATSRACSLVGAFACALLAVALATRLGAGPLAAGAGALGALAFPWSVFCAWAPGVPELPGTAFLLAALLLIAPRAPPDAPPSPARAVLAGAALGVACGHRYEAWFATAGVVVFVAIAWRNHPRSVVALCGAAAVLPAAWLAMNYARSGDALEFLHRVESYRVAHESLPSLAVRLARYPALAARHAGLLLALAALAARDGGRTARAAFVMAAAVLLGLMVTDARGGGPTHHASRALLPCVWIAAPAAAAWISCAWRERRSAGAWRALAITTAAALAQLPLGVLSPPRDVLPESVRAGIALSASPGSYFIEIERLDFLWAEWASGHPERARPDRAFGGQAPPDVELARRAHGCTAALVSSERASRTLARDGWRETAHIGPWVLLSPAP